MTDNNNRSILSAAANDREPVLSRATEQQSLIHPLTI